MNEEKYTFVLINIRKSTSNAYLPPYEMLGPNALSEHLSNNGIHVLQFPEKRVLWDEHIPNILSQIEKIPHGSVIGYSVATQTYDIFRMLLLELERRRKDLFSLAGGPHFCVPETAKKALTETPLNAAIVGHAGEFCEFFCNHPFLFNNHRQSEVAHVNLPPGLYLASADRIYGKGIGKEFPETQWGAANYYRRKDIGYIYLLTSEVCLNNCDYCFSPKIYYNDHFEKEVRVINKALSESKKLIIDIFDNASITTEKTWVFDLFEASRIKLCDTPVELVAYLDLADIAVSGWHRFDKFLAYGGKHIYIGRDTVSGKIAERIGRKYRGRVRKQDLLDAEKHVLHEIIHRSQKENLDLSISIDYIFSPWMDYNDIILQLFEMRELALLGQNHLDVSVEFQILCPFPGTRIYHSEKGNYVQLEKAPYDLVDYWLLDGSCAKNFLKLLDLLVYPNNYLKANNLQTNCFLILAAAFLAFGKGSDDIRHWCKQFLKFDSKVESFSDFITVFENKLRYIDHYSEDMIEKMKAFEEHRLKILFDHST